MKRSVAPSQLRTGVKKPKFIVPIKRTIDHEGNSPGTSRLEKMVCAPPITAFPSPADISNSHPSNVPDSVTRGTAVLAVGSCKSFHAPLQERQPSISSSADESCHAAFPKKEAKLYFSVVWCKRSSKKHKNWEGM